MSAFQTQLTQENEKKKERDRHQYVSFLLSLAEIPGFDMNPLSKFGINIKIILGVMNYA
jgi:hypothetical protein